MKVLVTGAAGFIAGHVSELLLERGHTVVGLDNFNDYYPTVYKRENAALLQARDNFAMVEGDIRDEDAVKALFERESFDAVAHLAAMAGVRVSLENPLLYVDVNVRGTTILLEASRTTDVGNFVFASTSSIYGNTEQIPFIETDPCNEVLAPYAATKKAGEAMAYTYHHVYGLPVTVVRFFTVYGERGRPDMMAYKLADSITKGVQIPLYNGGQMWRDWTYVKDIASGVVAAVERPQPQYEIINLGRGEPVLLAEFVEIIEELAGAKANLLSKPAPPTDVVRTYADVSKARRLLDYDPKISVREGVRRFWEWYAANRVD